MITNLKDLFGNIDIYLFDQLLKGRFDNCKNVIDIGCGNGRNLVYFLKNNFDVFAIDQNEEAIKDTKNLSEKLAPHNSISNFCVSLVESIPFQNNQFDIVICSAVLHFAKNKDHFGEMLHSIWRVLKPQGFLFVRLASNIGMEHLVSPIGNGCYLLPDGTERFLVDEATLLNYTNELNGNLFEPIKTTNVQNLRCMTTWCIQKNE
ncbi:MAG: class I SAM-dependent methyltransferase [Bacteroidia bacterium]